MSVRVVGVCGGLGMVVVLLDGCYEVVVGEGDDLMGMR